MGYTIVPDKKPSSVVLRQNHAIIVFIEMFEQIAKLQLFRIDVFFLMISFRVTYVNDGLKIRTLLMFYHEKCRFSNICKNVIQCCDISKCSLNYLVFKYIKLYYDWYNRSPIFYPETYCKLIEHSLKPMVNSFWILLSF